jgi:hypothetical protein
MALADQCIAFPVPNLTAIFNMPRAIANRSATNDLPTSVATARISLPALPLASQALVKIAANRFIRYPYGSGRLVEIFIPKIAF